MMMPSLTNMLLQSMAKRTWPADFPELFSIMEQFVQDKDGLIVGLHLLKSIAEEFLSSANDVSAGRKQELRTLLFQHAPGITSMLQEILDSKYTLDISQRHSPRSTSKSGPFGTEISFLSPGTPSVYSGLPAIGASPTVESTVYTSPSLGSTTLATCRLCLETLAQLFSSVPLQSLITPSLLATLAQYASLQSSEVVELGVLALGCLNEIVSKNFVPAGFQDFLLQVIKHIFGLLETITERPDTLKDLDDV
jgi:hypothetical protein